LYNRKLKHREIKFAPQAFPGKNNSPWRNRKTKKKLLSQDLATICKKPTS